MRTQSATDHSIERMTAEARRLSAPSGKFLKVRIISRALIVRKDDLRAIPAANCLLPGDGTAELQVNCVAEVDESTARQWVDFTKRNRHLPGLAELVA